MLNLQKAFSQRPEKTCAIMMDTKGPEIRTCSLKEQKPVELKEGQTFNILIDTAMEGDATRVACTYKELCSTVNIGSQIFIDNGALRCEVTDFLEVSGRRRLAGLLTARVCRTAW